MISIVKRWECIQNFKSYILPPSTPPPLSSFLFPSFLLSYSLPLLLSSFPSSKHPSKIEDLNGQTTLLVLWAQAGG